jgi:flavin reductase
MDIKTFRDAMSHLAAAVNIITTDGSAGRCGFTATAVASVTDTPPTLLVCMNRASFLHSAFLENGRLCVNTLAGDQSGLSGVFANAHLDAEARFACGEWHSEPDGSPRLAGALAHFDCRIAQTVEIGTHSVFFCAVESLHCEPGAALVYFDRAYHSVPAPVAA